MSQHICAECGEAIRKGRSDKKFCDATCKDAFYNRIKEEERAEVKQIESILKSNRKILRQLFTSGKPDQLVSRDVLLKAGFDFDYHTHHVITKIKRNEFIFCYNYGYREMDKRQYKIIKSFK